MLGTYLTLRPVKSPEAAGLECFIRQISRQWTPVTSCQGSPLLLGFAHDVHIPTGGPSQTLSLGLRDLVSSTYIHLHWPVGTTLKITPSDPGVTRWGAWGNLG